MGAEGKLHDPGDQGDPPGSRLLPKLGSWAATTEHTGISSSRREELGELGVTATPKRRDRRRFT